MARFVVFVAPMVALALAVAGGCARSERRADEGQNFQPSGFAPRTLPGATGRTAASSATAAPSAFGGGPPGIDRPDAALVPEYTLDANAVLGERGPRTAQSKPDAQADGPSGGTYGASSDDRSPGAAEEQERAAGVDEPNTVGGP